MNTSTRQVRLSLLFSLLIVLAVSTLETLADNGPLVLTQVGAGTVGKTTFRTVLRFRNETVEAVSSELELYGYDGSPMEALFRARWIGTPGNVTTEGHRTVFEVPPTSALCLDLVPDSTTRIGWARLERHGLLETSAYFQYGHLAPPEAITNAFENTLLHEAENLPLREGKDFSFPVSLFGGTQEINTAFALVNLSAKPASVQLKLRPDQVREVVLEPGQLLSTYFTEFWPLVLPAVFPAWFESAAEVHSEAPLGLAVFRTLNGVPLSGVPVSSISGQTDGSPADIGAEFQLPYGETVTFESENLQVTFWNVAEDSRCPKEVVCIWEGQARIVLRVRQGDQVEDLELIARAGNADLATGEFGKYVFHLLGVDPYPEQPGTIDLQDYSVRLRVTLKQ